MERLGCFSFLLLLFLIAWPLSELGMDSGPALGVAAIIAVVVIPLVYGAWQYLSGNVCPHCGHGRSVLKGEYQVCEKCGGDMTAEHP